MGCCSGDREKGEVSREQRWDYITLSDFRSRSCGLYFSYVWLWILVIISVAIVCVDTFTAINLIAFDRWSSQVKPWIPFAVSKWIFAVCILLSFVLLAYQWVRCIRVMRRGGVAESYLDPIAVIVQSIRPQGWRRFLVFAELTKSKKGSDYVALFVYFSFKGVFNVILAEAPRQVVNALTLYSVMHADLLPTGDHSTVEGRPRIVQFFINVKILAAADVRQAAILFGMLFSLVIWVFSAITLALSFLIFVFYLWHHIPSADGGLTAYCRRKINKRMDKLVSDKVQEVIEQDEQKRLKQEKKAAKNGLPVPGEFKRQPTLPDLGVAKEEEAFDMSTLRTQPSFATLPQYSSQPTTPMDEPTLPDLHESGSPEHMATLGSVDDDMDAPLVGAAMPMGYSNPPSGRPPMQRNLTNSTRNGAASPALTTRTNATEPLPRGPSRMNTPGNARGPPGAFRPGPGPGPGRPYGPPRSNTMRSDQSFGPPSRTNTDISMGPVSRPPPSRSNTSISGMSSMSGPGSRPPPRSNTSMSSMSGPGSRPPPLRSNTGMSGGFQGGPPRSNTAPPPPSSAGSATTTTSPAAYTPFGQKWASAVTSPATPSPYSPMASPMSARSATPSAPLLPPGTASSGPLPSSASQQQGYFPHQKKSSYDNDIYDDYYS